MGRLIYSTIMSLDGFIADEYGNFDWAAPSEEVHRFVNDLERPVGTYLYGRRMYEAMAYWETAGEQTDFERDYAQIWRGANKVVYSRTLSRGSTARTRIDHNFDAETVRRMKLSSDRDLAIGGAELAAQALRQRVVDELHLFVVPYVVGGGKRALPAGVLAKLHLTDSRRFENGTMYLRYETVHS